MVVMLFISTIPTGIIGILLSDIISAANSMVIIPGICLVITALFLMIADIADIGQKRPKEATYQDAAAVGIAQGLAVMPGVSRSGTTITACLLCGFDKKFAVKYSFIMSVPAVIGAVLLECREVQQTVLQEGFVLSCAIASIVAAIVGYLSICAMVRFVAQSRYRGFCVYCLLVGIGTIIYYFL